VSTEIIIRYDDPLNLLNFHWNTVLVMMAYLLKMVAKKSYCLITETCY